LRLNPVGRNFAIGECFTVPVSYHTQRQAPLHQSMSLIGVKD
jgi:hypothetical protein